jgi:DNA modification methylase
VKPGARHLFNSGEQRSIYSNVIVATKVPIAERLHPAQKPVELTNFLVSLLTNEDDLVVDLFAGAGSTLVSAALSGRRWLGCDNDDRYPKIAEERAENAEFEHCNPLYLWVNGKLLPVGGD